MPLGPKVDVSSRVSRFFRKCSGSTYFLTARRNLFPSLVRYTAHGPQPHGPDLQGGGRCSQRLSGLALSKRSIEARHRSRAHALVRGAYMDAARTISWGLELRRVLLALLESGELLPSAGSAGIS